MQHLTASCHMTEKRNRDNVDRYYVAHTHCIFILSERPPGSDVLYVWSAGSLRVAAFLQPRSAYSQVQLCLCPWLRKLNYVCGPES